jgi:hypothetical protein
LVGLSPPEGRVFTPTPVPSPQGGGGRYADHTAQSAVRKLAPAKLDAL